MGAEVHYFEWTDSFAEARNYAISKATGEWIFSIDADERLLQGQLPILRQTLRTAQPEFGAFAVYCHSPCIDGTCTYPIKEVSWDVDQGTGVHHSVLRVFRNLPGVEFQNRCHETVEPSIRALGLKPMQSAIHLWHEGYREDYLKAQAKLERNRRVQEMDLAERPDDPWIHYNMGRTYAAMNFLDEAEREFRLASQMAPQDATWRGVLVRDWEILRRKQETAQVPA